MVQRFYGLSTSFQTGFKAHFTDGTQTSSVKLAKNLLRGHETQGEATTMIFLNSSKPGYPETNAALSPHQRSGFLQCTVMITETQSRPERREWATAECLALNDTPASLALPTWLLEHRGRGDEKNVGGRSRQGLLQSRAFWTWQAGQLYSWTQSSCGCLQKTLHMVKPVTTLARMRQVLIKPNLLCAYLDAWRCH